MVIKQLGLEDIETQFKVSFSDIPEALLRIKGKELISLYYCEKLIEHMKTTYKVHSPMAAASLFSKAYGRMICAVLYAMSCLNKRLPASLDQTSLNVDLEGRPHIIYLAPELLPCDTDRDSWREAIITELFSEHLKPVHNVLREYTGLNQNILWENTFVYVRHFYTAWLKQVEHTAIHSRIIEDFEYITAKNHGHLFGTEATNPFAVDCRWIPHPIQAGEALRIRQSCCLRYFMPDGKRCTVCPSVDDQAREQIFLQKQ